MIPRWQCFLTAAMTVALVAATPAVAHGSRHSHGHGGHHRTPYSQLPANSPPVRYCVSAKRQVFDARDCPEPPVAATPEAPVINGYRENR
jgi:hypothetical protein